MHNISDVSVRACVELLARLIAFRTHNPGGDEPALCADLADALRRRSADRVDVVEVPRNHDGVRETGAYVFARYGEPRTLINIHIDTVPANAGWSADPWTARIGDDRVIGLGAADTKGAIAALLVALDAVRPRDVGILLSGDEERGGTCIHHFIAGEHAPPIERAIVCEPTSRRAGVRHRGVMASRAHIEGRGGHSSGADRMPKPIVTMARLAVELDTLGRRYIERGPDDLKGVCLNVAGLDGGVAFNVVPDHASLTWSLRPFPGFDAAEWHHQVDGCVARAGVDIELVPVLDNPPFAVADDAWVRALIGDRVADLGTLQFWTEAAALSAAGIDAVVVGPGDIAQAHAADEQVAFDDLAWAIDLFQTLLERASHGK